MASSVVALIVPGLLFLSSLGFIWPHISTRKRRMPVNVPLVEPSTGSFSLFDLLNQGYEKYTRRNEIFKVNAPHGELLLLPPSMLDELENLPPTAISFAQSLKDQFLGQQTLIGYHDATLLRSLREEMARNMDQVILDLNDETQYALKAELPQGDDWKSFKVHPTVLRIIALLSGRVFVGKGMNRDERFVRAASMFTVDSFAASAKLHATKPWLRPFGRWLIPELAAVQRHLATMKQLIRPLLREATADQSSGIKLNGNMISWNLKNSPEKLRSDVDYQALQQLEATFVAIHTTTKLVTNIVFDLAARPEYTDPLREEISAVLAEDSGRILKSSMLKLKKLDSFMTEVQRNNPPGVMTFNRTTLEPITLSNGVHLPKGTFLAAATHAIGQDSSLWEHPERFDGFRFEKLRERPEQANKYQFVSTGHDMLSFGYGLQSCPGRFFVNNEVKIILVHLLSQFDLTLGLGNERSKPVTGGVNFKPDPNQEILIRARKQ